MPQDKKIYLKKKLPKGAGLMADWKKHLTHSLSRGANS